MKTSRAKSVVLGLFAVSAASLSFASGVNIQTLIPSTSNRYLFTEDALFEKNECRSCLLQARYFWVNDPFVVINRSKNSQAEVLVAHVHTLDLQYAHSLSSVLKLGIGLPINSSGAPTEKEKIALGDGRVFLKWRLNPNNTSLGVAFMPELRVPTGNKDRFLSDDSWGYGGRFSLEKDVGSFMLAAHLGFWRFAGSQFDTLVMKSRIPVGLGFHVPLDAQKKWALNVEGNVQPILPLNSEINPSLFYAGVGRTNNDGWNWSVGGGIGKAGGASGNDVSLIASLSYRGEKCKDREEPAPAPVVQAPEPKPTPKPVRVKIQQKEISIQGEVKFQEGKDVLTEEGKDILDEMAQVIRDNVALFKKIYIDGHTNRNGKAPFNQKLSERRSKTVKENLVSRGVPGDILFPRGFGMSRPKKVKGLTTKQRLEVDRRVEFLIERK